MDFLPYDIKLLIYKVVHCSYVSELHSELFELLIWNDDEQTWCGTNQMLIYRCFNFRKYKSGKWYLHYTGDTHKDILRLISNGKPVKRYVGKIMYNY